MHIQQLFVEICIEVGWDNNVISSFGDTEAVDSSLFIFNMNL